MTDIINAENEENWVRCLSCEECYLQDDFDICPNCCSGACIKITEDEIC